MFDLAAALAGLDGDEDLIRELAGLFLEEWPRLLGDVRVAVEAGDARALDRAAHAIKGRLANFRARAASDAAQRLEALGKEGRVADAPAALKALETSLEALVPALAELGAAPALA